jgi:hypothetical protein
MKDDAHSPRRASSIAAAAALAFYTGACSSSNPAHPGSIDGGALPTTCEATGSLSLDTMASPVAGGCDAGQTLLVNLTWASDGTANLNGESCQAYEPAGQMPLDGSAGCLFTFSCSGPIYAAHFMKAPDAEVSGVLINVDTVDYDSGSCLDYVLR